MCLDIYNKKNLRKRFAWRDITCYKFLVRTDYVDYRTPYKNFKIEIGETYKSELVLTKYHEFYASVSQGIHSLETIKNVRAVIDGDFYESKATDFVIVKCIIPRFSRYYVGEFVNQKSFASDRLKYVEIIDSL